MVTVLPVATSAAQESVTDLRVRYEDGRICPYRSVPLDTSELTISVWELEELGLRNSPNERIASIDGLASLHQMRRLTFSNIVTQGSFSFLSELTQVEELTLHLVEIEETGFLAGMRSLRELAFSESWFAGQLSIDLSANPSLEYLHVDIVRSLPDIKSVPRSLRVVQIVGDYELVVENRDSLLLAFENVPYVFLPGCVVSEEALVSYPNVSTAYLTPDEIDALLGDLRAGRAVDRSRFRDES